MVKNEKFHILSVAPLQPFGQFQELAETLLWGLRGLGYTADMSPDGFSDSATNIVLGAGSWVSPSILQMIPAGSIIYLTEPIYTSESWATSALPRLNRPLEIWDYSMRNVQLLTSQGLEVTFAPVAYVPQLSRISKASDQDIDIFFYGAQTERRVPILRQLSETGLIVRAEADCYSLERDALIARAKVVLNLHFSNNFNIFEMVRASYLLSNHKAVVAEVDEETDMQVHLREAVAGVPYEQLVQTCLELVADDERRTALEERGFEIFSSQPEEEVLRPLLEKRKSTFPAPAASRPAPTTSHSQHKPPTLRKSCLLISPPDIGHDLPRGLLELASFLEASGISCEILLLAHELDYPRRGGAFGSIDQWQTELLLRDALRRTQASVVGVSNQHAPNYPDCFKILELCKQIDPNLVTVMGGPHVTFLDAEAAADPAVDVVVRGEGEWTLLDLLDTVQTGRDLASVQGITFQRDGQLIRTPDRTPGDLDDLPPVDFGLFPEQFVRQAAIYGALSRGCPFHCSFCAESAFWKKSRRHPIRRLIDEMLVLQNNYGRPMDAIEGSMIAIGSRQSMELCQQIMQNKIELPPGFYAYTRLDTITDEGMQAMKQAGILNLWVGVESASERVLKMMNKHINYDQTIAACERLRDHGLSARTLWVIGHPGDNPQEASYSLGELKRLYNQQLIAEAQPALFMPYPGTRFYDQPEKYGLQILSYDWRRWERWSGKPIHQLDEFPAEKIADFYQKTRQVVNAHQDLKRLVDSVMPGAENPKTNRV